MKNQLIVLVLFVLFPADAIGQEIRTESEVGGSGGTTFVSNFFFLEDEGYGLFLRHFWVDGTQNRFEFAIGPNFSTTAVRFKVRIGATNDGEILLGNITVLNQGRLVHVAKAFVSTTDKASTLYQKLYVRLGEKNPFHLRAEHLFVAWERSGFLRVGVEWRGGGSPSLFFAPFVDFVGHKVGIQGGFRF